MDFFNCESRQFEQNFGKSSELTSQEFSRASLNFFHFFLEEVNKKIFSSKKFSAQEKN